MSPEEIERLSNLAHKAGVTELDLSEDGCRIRLKISPSGSASPVPRESEQSPPRKAARAAGIGIFRHAHPLTGKALISAGDAVTKGQTVGYLEAGPSLRAVLADSDGIIGAPLCADGTLVGYGTALYPID